MPKKSEPKSKRGGKRAGAGRKPTMIAKAADPVNSELAKAHIQSMTENEGPASSLVSVAYATLLDVMDNSPFSAPRVTAARAIIDLAKAEKMAVSGGGVGKKEQQQATASKMATGKFATPGGPRLVVNN